MDKGEQIEKKDPNPCNFNWNAPLFNPHETKLESDIPKTQQEFKDVNP